MRKKRCKALNPNRNKAFEILRRNRELHLFTDENGKEIYLNLNKMFLLNRQYINPEFQDELNRNYKKLSSLYV